MSATRRAATLPVSFFERPAEVVARDLVGTMLRSTLGGATDRRTASWRPRPTSDATTPRRTAIQDRRHAQNEALFGPPGTWYVYLSYGIHWCANLVCGPPGHASAVLLRALEPVQGLETMRERRGGVADRQLCSGPGKLCQALAITRDQDGAPMRGSGLTVTAPDASEPPVLTVTPRIGITKAAEWPLRFTLDGSPWVSRGPMHRGP